DDGGERSAGERGEDGDEASRQRGGRDEGRHGGSPPTMGRALLVVGLVATLGFAAGAVLGYGTDPAAESLRLHVLVALASVLLLLFSHCWIMFYLIGTGKAIKEAVAEHGLDPAAVEETKRFKNESYP